MAQLRGSGGQLTKLAGFAASVPAALAVSCRTTPRSDQTELSDPRIGMRCGEVFSARAHAHSQQSRLTERARGDTDLLLGSAATTAG
jgi:hypothetical protein